MHALNSIEAAPQLEYKRFCNLHKLTVLLNDYYTNFLSNTCEHQLYKSSRKGRKIV
jgi:hypothetical protein